MCKGCLTYATDVAAASYVDNILNGIYPDRFSKGQWREIDKWAVAYVECGATEPCDVHLFTKN